MSAHLLAMATLWHLLWVLKQRSPMIGVSEPIQNSFILVLAPSKFPTRISWTVLLWLAHLASPLSGLCRQAHVFRGVHYHWVLALSWNWIVSTEIFSSNLATSVDYFGILDTLYMDRFWMTSKRSIWSMLETVHLQNLISPRWQHQGKTMQSQPKQSVTQGHFTQTSFPLCGKHCWTPLSVFFTLSPEGQEHRTHVDRQQADQIPSFQATSHLLQKGIRMQTIWAVSPPSKTTEVILVYMFMDSRQPPLLSNHPSHAAPILSPRMYWLFGPTSNILYSQLLLGRPDPWTFFKVHSTTHTHTQRLPPWTFECIDPLHNMWSFEASRPSVPVILAQQCALITRQLLPCHPCLQSWNSRKPYLQQTIQFQVGRWGCCTIHDSEASMTTLIP